MQGFCIMKRTPFKKSTSQLKRTGFEQKATVPLKRTVIKKVGRVGEANLKANKLIRKVIQEEEMTEMCEIQLSGCLVNYLIQIAHRHKRAWYKGDAELLADKKQWIRGCDSCHNKIEFDSELTEKMFEKLRGGE